jgi:hypothetical protein
MKRKGDKGSPCLRPLSGQKRPKVMQIRIPLIRMENDGEVMQIRIQLIHIGENPSLDIMAKIKLHSIWSKAFSISILTAMSPPQPLFEFIELNSSCTIMVLS